MIHVDISDIYKIKYILLWSLLSFKAGLLNSAGFLIVGSFVSHVTGFGTQIGIELVHSDYIFSVELLVIPIAFIGGAVLTSLVLDKAYSKGKIPPYPIIQLLITLLLGIISVCFSMGIFDITTLNAQHERTIFFIGLLCLTCGLKNGLTTWATQGKIRTTHLTGLSTDIGLHLPKIFRPEGSTSRYPEPRKVSYVRIVILLSFSSGACLSAILIPIIGYELFYIAFAISTVLFTVSVIHRSQVRLPPVSNTPSQVYE